MYTCVKCMSLLYVILRITCNFSEGLEHLAQIYNQEGQLVYFQLVCLP